MDSRSVVDFRFATIITTTISIVLLIKAAAATNVSNSSRGRELEALKDFGWLYINSTTDHCEWNGITCDDAARVAEIRLQGYESWFWFDKLDVLAFPSLTRIHLTSCGLHGEIPQQIGSLSRLTYLNLSTNIDVWGELPLSLPNLTDLQVLDISSTEIIGAIFPEIGSLSRLTYIRLSFNSLSGNLPLSLANLTNLQVFDISYNSIYGAIPLEIGSLSKLSHLRIPYREEYFLI